MYFRTKFIGQSSHFYYAVHMLAIYLFNYSFAALHSTMVENFDIFF